jgi:hypothetical protein
MASDYDDDDRDRRDDRFDDDDSSGSREDRVIQRAKNRIKTPAVVLLVVGVIGGLMSLMNIPSLFTMDAQLKQVEDQWDQDPNLKPEQKKEMKQMLADLKGPIKLVVPLTIVFGLLTAGLTILGAVKIMNLQSRGLGVLACIISMLPILSGCCCLGLPVGIWVLIVMGKPEVKAGFAAVAKGASEY